MPHVRSVDCLDPDRCGLLVVDVQQKLMPAIPTAEQLVGRVVRLVEAAGLLGVPAAATVQYPKGLGPLVEPLQKTFKRPEEKLDFSAAVCRDALDRWAQSGRDQIVVAGVETHVCVLQTVLDLIAEGQRPFVVVDAVGSRVAHDHDVAIERMRDSGATVITSEAVLFEWLGTADRPEFKSIARMIK